VIAVRKEWPVLDSDEEAIRNMAMALILRAMRDVVRYRDAKKPKFRKIYEDVHNWMYVHEVNFTDDPLDQLMSFEGICDILGWNPDWLRQRVKTLTSADLDKLGRNGNGIGLIR
jgi:hypothetical protein